MLETASEVNAQIVTLSEKMVAHIIKEWVRANSSNPDKVKIAVEFELATEDAIEVDIIIYSRFEPKTQAQEKASVQSTD